jgi:preprotein translocase subunit SecA
MQAPREMHYDHAAAPALDDFEQQAAMPADQEKQVEQPFIREGAKVGRNDPCPCGSGKKYKQCHGQLS